MAKTRSIARAAKRAVREDAKMRTRDSRTLDSFQNFSAKLGVGTDNIMSAGTYGFNPVTRMRTLLEWIHRGSWLGGVAIDLVGDDMTRAGVDLRGTNRPEDVEQIERALTTWQVWNQVNDVVRWSRLYGGALGVMLVDGQRLDTPLRMDTIRKGQFKGLQVLDRWMVEPTLNDLVTDLGPNLGLPKFYTVIAEAPALPRMKIHYTRCLRMEGIRLPYQQRMTENMWGESVLERIYDRMIAFDSATTGGAQLVYKAYIRTYKIEGLREIVAMGGQSEANLVKAIDFMRRFQSIEGMTLLDAKDDFVAGANNAFGGLSEALIHFGQQLSGALQIPLVRLFGQSPAGLNSTGESDLRTYYEGIKQRQEMTLRVPLTTIIRALAAGEGILLPEGFTIDFRSLWTLTDADKTQISASDTATVVSAFNSSIVDQPTALQELRQSSRVTGRWTNITDGKIKAAEQQSILQNELQTEQQIVAGEQQKLALESGKQQLLLPNRTTKDQHLGEYLVLGKPIVIEHGAGEDRYGTILPADYGYIRRTDSAERGQQMDCFVGPDKNSSQIYVVDSYRADGFFDEHKVMFGYANPIDALRDFNAYYKDYRGIITNLSHGQFDAWLGSDVTRPLAQPVETHYTDASTNPETICAKCLWYVRDNQACINPLVQRDPKVAEENGHKVVEPSGWCAEFTR